MIVFQPGSDIFGLQMIGGCRDISDGLRMFKLTVYLCIILIELIGKVRQVLGDEISGFLVLIGRCRHIIRIEVPVEFRLSLLTQTFEQLLLHFLQ